MSQQETVISRREESILATNSVLRNTYLLLAMTLLFSAATAGYAMVTGAPPLSPWIVLIGYFGLLFVTQALSRSGLGLIAIFALTGFMGYTLGPLLNYYLSAFSNGSQLIMTALGGTGVTFVALSGYTLVSRKDFSYLGGFLFVAMITAFLAGLAAMVFNMPLLDLFVSAAFILISSGIILFQTSEIIHGGERNYIMATITLYVSLYNIFINLLQILSVLAGNRD